MMIKIPLLGSYVNKISRRRGPHATRKNPSLASEPVPWTH